MNDSFCPLAVTSLPLPLRSEVSTPIHRAVLVELVAQWPEICFGLIAQSLFFQIPNIAAFAVQGVY